MEIFNYTYSAFLEKMVIESFELQGIIYFWNEEELRYYSNDGECIFYKVVEMMEEELYKY